MAKKSTVTVQLVNEDFPDNGTKYIVKVTTKGTKASNKLKLRKYDPKTMKHHVFIQKKLPSPK
jgi:large subunit ribosomal protein L33